VIRALTVACLLPCAAAAQVVCALGAGAGSYDAAKDQRPTADALELVGQTYTPVKGLCGGSCPEVVLFRNATAANLMLIVSAGRAKVVYNPQFFTNVYNRHGDAGIAAVMAHEIGHALDDTLGAAWVDKRWTQELRADGWAGCVLAKNGLTPTHLLSALAALEENPSPAHPAWSLRMPAIRAGYVGCGGGAGAGTAPGAARGR